MRCSIFQNGVGFGGEAERDQIDDSGPDAGRVIGGMRLILANDGQFLGLAR